MPSIEKKLNHNSRKYLSLRSSSSSSGLCEDRFILGGLLELEALFALAQLWITFATRDRGSGIFRDPLVIDRIIRVFKDRLQCDIARCLSLQRVEFHKLTAADKTSRDAVVDDHQTSRSIVSICGDGERLSPVASKLRTRVA